MDYSAQLLQCSVLSLRTVTLLGIDKPKFVVFHAKSFQYIFNGSNEYMQYFNLTFYISTFEIKMLG
jgi:hypothetical protein